MTDEDHEDVVVLRSVGRGEAELATLELWDRGATAVEERDHGGGAVLLVASYPTARAARVVAAQLGLETTTVAPGWRDVWKQHATTVEVGTAMAVAPAWRPVPVMEGRIVLEIDSGPCFGSGSHASTRLILQLLAESPPVGLRVLDVGTGSGILAVAAARLGAAAVVAVDVDPEAPAVVEANARRNRVDDRIQVSSAPVADLRTAVDLALVNLTAGLHAEVAEAVVTRVRPGGALWLAGLLPGQWPHIGAAYAGCRVVDLPELDGWVGAVLYRT